MDRRRLLLDASLVSWAVTLLLLFQAVLGLADLRLIFGAVEFPAPEGTVGLARAGEPRADPDLLSASAQSFSRDTPGSATHGVGRGSA